MKLIDDGEGPWFNHPGLGIQAMVEIDPCEWVSGCEHKANPIELRAYGQGLGKRGPCLRISSTGLGAGVLRLIGHFRQFALCIEFTPPPNPLWQRFQFFRDRLDVEHGRHCLTLPGASFENIGGVPTFHPVACFLAFTARRACATVTPGKSSMNSSSSVRLK